MTRMSLFWTVVNGWPSNLIIFISDDKVNYYGPKGMGRKSIAVYKMR
jgi:hypothetical protein